MRRNLFVFVLLCLAATLFAQQSTVQLSGIIRTAKGEPVKGVEFAVVGGGKHAKSKKNGEFLLKKILPNDQIEVVVEKKRVAKFPLNGNTAIKIDLLDNHIRVLTEKGGDDMYALEAVPPKAKRNSGVVTAEMIERSSATTLKEILRQFVPHIEFISTADGVVPNFRGQSSIYHNSGALVIVDGSEMSFSAAEGAVNRHDIATIEVNKSGAGFGVRGAGGAIIIKTKR